MRCHHRGDLDAVVREVIPLLDLGCTKDLAERAKTAEPCAHQVTAHVSVNAELAADVVAGEHRSAGNQPPSHGAVRHKVALLTQAGRVEFAQRADTAEPPAPNAAQAAHKVCWRSALGRHVPQLVPLAGSATPVLLVETKEALDAAILNIVTDAHDVITNMPSLTMQGRLEDMKIVRGVTIPPNATYSEFLKVGTATKPPQDDT